MPTRTHTLLGAVASGTLLLTGCAASDSGPGGPATDGVQVLASFYPLQYVAEQVGGERVTVSSLTPPGAEPHDVELSPSQVRGVSDTDLVVYLSGFQNAVDEAVDARDPQHVVDAADAVDLVGGEAEHAPESEDHAADEHSADEHSADEHSADEHTADDGHDHGTLDPHFWLDPERLAALAGPVAEELAEIDPDNAAAYAAAAERLVADLTDLDAAFSEGLADCERRVIVTSHEAFGYLALAYDLEQAGISGLDPEAEPSPARLRAIGDVIQGEGVTTVFTETLVNPKVAETLAADLGVQTALLDPIESLSDSASDYRSVMEQNLAALRSGLGCA